VLHYTKSYEVEDVDVEGSSSEADTSNTVRKVSWNTTLKSIIPLPVPDKPETFPTVPLPPGTDVLGLYPDTTTFYLGKIESVPTQKSRKYKICFENDGHTGPVKVGMEHVVQFS
jgi:SAGA-associated factor 29